MAWASLALHCVTLLAHSSWVCQRKRTHLARRLSLSGVYAIDLGCKLAGNSVQIEPVDVLGTVRGCNVSNSLSHHEGITVPCSPSHRSGVPLGADGAIRVRDEVVIGWRVVSTILLDKYETLTYPEAGKWIPRRGC